MDLHNGIMIFSVSLSIPFSFCLNPATIQGERGFKSGSPISWESALTTGIKVIRREEKGECPHYPFQELGFVWNLIL